VQARGLQPGIAGDQGQVVGDAVLSFAEPVIRPGMANGRTTELSVLDVHGSGAFGEAAGYSVTS
jgi:hypothetical protein